MDKTTSSPQFLHDQQPVARNCIETYKVPELPPWPDGRRFCDGCVFHKIGHDADEGHDGDCTWPLAVDVKGCRKHIFIKATSAAVAAYIAKRLELT